MQKLRQLMAGASKLRGASAIALGYYGNYAFQGIYFIALARLLDADGFGLFAGTLAAISVVAVFSGFGAGNVMVMRAARDPGRLAVQLGTAYAYVGTLGTGLVLAGVALTLWGGVGVAGVAIPLLMAELWGARIFEISLQAHQAVDRLKAVALLTTAAAGIRALLSGVALMLVGHLSVSTWALLYLGSSVLVAAGATLSTRLTVVRPALEQDAFLSTWRLGSFFAVGQSSRLVYTDLDKTVLLAFAGPGVAGVYAAGYRLLNLAYAPIQALVYASNTKLFRAGAGGHRAAWPTLRRLLLTVFGVGAITAAAIVLLRTVPALLLGPGYGELEQMLPWLAPLVIITGVHYALGDTLMGMGRQSIRAGLQLATASLAIGLYWILIPQLSWLGAALGSIVAEVVLLLGLVGVYWAGFRREHKVSV